MEAYFFQCPYCWEQISILIDTSQNQQKYIEDCEVCCHPIELEIHIHDCEIISFQAHSINQ